MKAIKKITESGARLPAGFSCLFGLFGLFGWLNQTNQINKTNQMNQTDRASE